METSANFKKKKIKISIADTFCRKRLGRSFKGCNNKKNR